MNACGVLQEEDKRKRFRKAIKKTEIKQRNSRVQIKENGLRTGFATLGFGKSKKTPETGVAAGPSASSFELSMSTSAASTSAAQSTATHWLTTGRLGHLHQDPTEKSVQTAPNDVEEMMDVGALPPLIEIPRSNAIRLASPAIGGPRLQNYRIQPPEIRSGRLEIGGRRLEIGDRRLEIRSDRDSLEIGGRQLEIGDWRPETESHPPEIRLPPPPTGVQQQEIGSDSQEIRSCQLEIGNHPPDFRGCRLEIGDRQPETESYPPEIREIGRPPPPMVVGRQEIGRDPPEIKSHLPETRSHPPKIEGCTPKFGGQQPEIRGQPPEIRGHPPEMRSETPEIGHHPPVTGDIFSDIKRSKNMSPTECATIGDTSEDDRHSVLSDVASLLDEDEDSRWIDVEDILPNRRRRRPCKRIRDQMNTQLQRAKQTWAMALKHTKMNPEFVQALVGLHLGYPEMLTRDLLSQHTKVLTKLFCRHALQQPGKGFTKIA
jgi:hypothetical protein